MVELLDQIEFTVENLGMMLAAMSDKVLTTTEITYLLSSWVGYSCLREHRHISVD
jgi:hypothetical protein